VQNMEQISALGYFPNFDIEQAKRSESLFMDVTQAYVTTLALLFRESYWGMHFKNRDIVNSALRPQTQKRLNE
jgi:hypothetical protein